MGEGTLTKPFRLGLRALDLKAQPGRREPLGDRGLRPRLRRKPVGESE